VESLSGCWWNGCPNERGIRNVNANLVFRWRHQYQEGAFGPVNQSATFLPVQVIEASTDASHTIPSQPVSHSEIVIELGKAKLRITGAPDPQTVQLIVQQLLR